MIFSNSFFIKNSNYIMTSWKYHMIYILIWSKHLKFVIFNKDQLFINLIIIWIRQHKLLLHFSTLLVFVKVIERVKGLGVKLRLSLSDHDLHPLWVILPLLLVRDFLLNLIKRVVWVAPVIVIKDKHPILFR